MQTGVAIEENSWQLPIKVNLYLPPSNLTPRYLPNRTEHVCSHKNLDADFYSSSIDAHQTLETTQMPFPGRMN